MFNDNDRLQQMEDNWNNEIIGYDKGDYYTDTEYVSDDVAVEQGFEPETMQERADEFRKDDSTPSEPEPDFLEGVQVCRIDNEDCEVCQ